MMFYNLLRYSLLIPIHALYRIKITGLENIPKTGPVILTCNHVSYMDILIIGSCIKRPIRFVIYYKIHKTPILNFIFKLGKTIPIASVRENWVVMKQGMKEIESSLKNGEVVCIFPEGGLTSNGKLLEFKTGVQQILNRIDVPVVPMALTGMWGSWFSHIHGQICNHWPRRIFGGSKVKLEIDIPLKKENFSTTKLYDSVFSFCSSSSLVTLLQTKNSFLYKKCLVVLQTSVI